MHTGRVLVVSDDVPTVDRWVAWLDLAGYTVITCQGPGDSPNCARAFGGRCARREMVAAAIVDLDCDEGAGLCTTQPDDGSSVFVRRGSVGDRHDVILGAVDRAIREPRVEGLGQD